MNKKNPRTRPAKMGRARKMYAVRPDLAEMFVASDKAEHLNGSAVGISVLPRDRATQEAMIEAGAKAASEAYYRHTGAVKLGTNTSAIIARACLAAVGLVDKENKT